MSTHTATLSIPLAELTGQSVSARPGAAPEPIRPAAPQTAAPARPVVRGRYDAASTTEENRNHWANADGMSANAANSPTVRQILRNRSRYEAQNNGYCKGLLRTRRNDVVGTGPRLQLTLPNSFETIDPDFGVPQTHDVPASAASAIESRWVEWCDAVGLADKLRVMHETADRDGECFAVMVNNPALTGVQLDLRLFEADQVSTPDLWWHDPHAVDGIRFDDHGNPIEYHFLRSHPGDLVTNGTNYDKVRAAGVLHWFDPDRPNQARGIPALTAALPLYAQLRRYTLATLASAEFAASISGVMKTKAGIDPVYQPGPGPQPQVAPASKPFDRVELERNALLSLPEGWDASGFDAKQPVTGYGEFKKEVLTESGAAINAPRNVSTKSSAEYNYSSARLDHIPYRADAAISRDRLRRLILARVFREWVREARLIPGYLPADLPPVSAWWWQWQWDGVPSIDPVKDATADDIGLKNGTKTMSDVLGDAGKDWEEHMRQKAREIALARQLEAEHKLAPGTLYPIAPMSAVPVQPVIVRDQEDANAEPATAT